MKRATSNSLINVGTSFYFNPHPREEGDRRNIDILHTAAYFNPHPREEGDLLLQSFGDTVLISIHALVKRATSRNCLSKKFQRYFNPRPREEGDCISEDYIEDFSHFNPRPREEGDVSEEHRRIK